MFTSLRSRLWLSYALVIAVALFAVVVVLFIFLIRNPVLYRETQQRLRAVQSQLAVNPRVALTDREALSLLAQANDVRILAFDSDRRLLLDTLPEGPQLPFPRRNILGRNSQLANDAQGGIWLYAVKRLANNSVLVVAAPRPSTNLLNVFADEFLMPILEGGLVALLLSLVFAFANFHHVVAVPLNSRGH